MSNSNCYFNCFIEQLILPIAETVENNKNLEKHNIITMEDVIADEVLYALHQAENTESVDNVNSCNENNCGSEEVINNEYVMHFASRSAFPISIDDQE